MNINYEYPVMIFKNEYQGNVFYSLGLSKKNQDGSYTNGYMSCQFKKGVTIEDKTKINIKKAWLSFYLKDKETKPYIFIAEYELENAQNNQNIVQNNDFDPFADFGAEISIDDDFLD